MNPSRNSNNNYVISMLDNIIVTLVELDPSNSTEVLMSIEKREWVQDWVNTIGNLDIDNITENINNIDLIYIQSEVKVFNLPKIELVNIMNLDELNTYEIMLLEVYDELPFNISLAANFLFHLKIIHNHQLYKFQIFA